MEGVELPVEVFQAFQGPEVGGFGSSGQLSLMAHVQLVLEDQFEELGVAQPGGGGLLQPHGQGLGQAGEAKLAQGGVNLSHRF